MSPESIHAFFGATIDLMPDPFDILGVPASFDVDGAKVRQAWLALSGRLHPDRVEAGAEPDAEIARRTAELNRARRILDDPEERACALLARLGGASSEDDKSLPPTFLMEIMEVRQGLEAAQAAGGDVESFREWAVDQRKDLQDRLRGLFDRAMRNDQESLAEIRLELNVWRYLERMLEQIDDARSGL